MNEKITFEFFDEINSQTTLEVWKKFKEILETNKKSEVIPKIYIFINSTEGNVREGIAIHDILNLLPNEKIGIVLGNSCDATNPIFLGCDKKYITPNSIFTFIPNYSGFYFNLIPDSEIKESLKNTHHPSTIKLFQNDKLINSKLADFILTNFNKLFEDDNVFFEKI